MLSADDIKQLLAHGYKIKKVDAPAKSDGGPVRFSRSKSDVASVSRNPAATPLYEVMRQLSRFDSSFQTAISNATDLATISKEMMAKAKGADKYKGFTATNGTELHQGKRKPVISLRIKLETGKEVKFLDIFEAESKTPFVVIGNEEAGQRVGGALAYQVAFAWAKNNGKRMIPDPAGLTVINRLRRSEAMISSAMHFGTTEHLEPHQDQYVALLEQSKRTNEEPQALNENDRPDLFNELKEKLWTNENSASSIASNVQHLIEASNALAAIREPSIRQFQVANGVLGKRNVDGGVRLENMPSDVTDGNVKIQGSVFNPTVSGVGFRTVQRFAITESVKQAIQHSQGVGSRILLREQSKDNRNASQVALNAIRGVLGDIHSGTHESLNGVMYSSGNEATGNSLPVAQVSRIVDAVRSQWANAPDVIVVENMDDANVPQKVRDDHAAYVASKKGAASEPNGFFFDGNVYVVAGQMGSAQDVITVLFHEALGHVGLRGVFGKSLEQILNQVILARRSEVLAKARQYKLDVNSKADLQTAAEEVLAELAETHPELGIVKRIIAAISNFLRDNVPGFAEMKMTDDEIIQKFILPARRFVEKGTGRAGGRTAFSMSANTQPAAPFKAPEVRNADGKLLAPNGKVSKLTEGQWHQVRSPEFKAWFGDFEKLDLQKRFDAFVESALEEQDPRGEYSGPT